MSLKDRLKKSVLRKIYHAISIKKIMFRKNIKRIDRFDAEYGTDFGGRLYQNEIGVELQRANDYSPSPEKELIHVMKSSDLNKNDSIADLGCGKGYAMYLMSKFPVGKIGGVELSEKLCRIAQDNLNKLLKNSSIIWDVDCSDAGKWDKYDEYNIFYIYNSFPRVVMEEVKNRIEESIGRKHRKVFVWYLYPEFPDVFLSDPNWELLSRDSWLKIRHGMHVFMSRV